MKAKIKKVRQFKKSCYCVQNAESEWHLFIGCKKAKEFWLSSGIWHIIESNIIDVDGFKELVFYLLHTLQPQQTTQLAITLWTIWKCQNQIIWENDETPPNIAMSLSMKYLQEWLVARSCKSNSHQPQSATQSRWSKPPQGFYKCNLDAVIFKDKLCFGATMCLHDSNGVFFKAAIE